MGRLSLFLLLELLLNLVAVFLLGSFIADHLAEPRFLLPAAALDLCAAERGDPASAACCATSPAPT